jgi:hypothetical protein
MQTYLPAVRGKIERQGVADADGGAGDQCNAWFSHSTYRDGGSAPRSEIAWAEPICCNSTGDTDAGTGLVAYSPSSTRAIQGKELCRI